MEKTEPHRHSVSNSEGRADLTPSQQIPESPESPETRFPDVSPDEQVLATTLGIGPGLLEQFCAYGQEVVRSNQRLRLVASQAAGSLWRRHLLDSAQLMPLVLACGRGGGAWADLGSGGGFPGCVLALWFDDLAKNEVSRALLANAMAKRVSEKRPGFGGADRGHAKGKAALRAVARSGGPSISLIERDPGKAAFLQNMAEEFHLEPRLSVISQAVGQLAAPTFDGVTARAVAPLVRLLPLIRLVLKPGGVACLPKGASWAVEAEAARKAGVLAPKGASKFAGQSAGKAGQFRIDSVTPSMTGDGSVLVLRLSANHRVLDQTLDRTLQGAPRRV